MELVALLEPGGRPHQQDPWWLWWARLPGETRDNLHEAFLLAYVKIIDAGPSLQTLNNEVK